MSLKLSYHLPGFACKEPFRIYIEYSDMANDILIGLRSSDILISLSQNTFTFLLLFSFFYSMFEIERFFFFLIFFFNFQFQTWISIASSAIPDLNPSYHHFTSKVFNLWTLQLMLWFHNWGPPHSICRSSPFGFL